MKRASKKSKPATARAQPSSSWTYVRIKFLRENMPIVRAIAAVMATKAPEGQPWTVEQVLQYALEEGLVAVEKDELGTSSLDPHARPAEEHEYPKSTPVLQALLKAVGGARTS